jgi:hypothetical protein
VKPPPEKRADTRQQADMRAELIACANRICDHYPNIAHEASFRGYPTNLRQDEPRSTGELTSVEAAANTPDPHTDWLTLFYEMRSHVRVVDARGAILDPPKAKRLGRETSVEICSLCNKPIAGLIKRKDGNPYCAGPAGNDWCYYKVWRNEQ